MWNPDTHPGAWRAVWSYSAKRARRDQKTINAQEARARAIVAGDKTAKSARFVTVRGDDRSFDETSLTRARSLVGLKGYVTNLAAAVMPAVEVIAKYHDLWHVEKSFRMSKSDLRARPMFHYTRDAIEAHLTIVFTALAVSHCIQARTGLAIGKVAKQLRPLRSATITINGATQTFPPEIPRLSAKFWPTSASNRGTRRNVLSQAVDRKAGRTTIRVRQVERGYEIDGDWGGLQPANVFLLLRIGTGVTRCIEVVGS